MAKKITGKKKVKNQRKFGREKRKKGRFGSPISAFVRNRITAAEYFKLTGQAKA